MTCKTLKPQYNVNWLCLFVRPKFADASESDTAREHEATQAATDRQHELEIAKLQNKNASVP